MRPSGAELASIARAVPDATIWPGGDFRQRCEAWLRRGIELPVSQFDALAAAGGALLVPQASEHLILNEGADPLKTF